MKRLFVHYQGGLGNQLFQYFTAAEYASRWGAITVPNADSTVDLKDLSRVLPKIDFTKVPIPEYFSPPFFEKIVNKSFGRYISYHPPMVYERYFDYDPGLMLLDPGTCDVIDFRGYWHDIRYFYGTNTFSSVKLSDEGLLSPTEVNDGVCLHVRLGDYLSKSSSKLYRSLTGEDYRRALSLLGQVTPFQKVFVYTNQVDRVMEYLPSGFNYIIMPPMDTFNTFQQMRSFKRYIIPNSTFSWWASFLSIHPDKKVCMPGRWFKKFGYSDKGYKIGGCIEY